MPLEPAALLEVAERYTAAWCSQDPAAVAAFFSPGGSLTINRGAPAAGRDAIAAAARTFMTAFPDMRVTLDRVVALGETAEYHWTLTGTNNGSGGTGRAVRISGFETWRFGSDGLIASSEGSFDSEEYRRQLEEGS